jgi:hypothetical protein
MIHLKSLGNSLEGLLAADPCLFSASLINLDGSLISFAPSSNLASAKQISAIASNVWFAYDCHSRPVGGQGLSVVAADLEPQSKGVSPMANNASSQVNRPALSSIAAGGSPSASSKVLVPPSLRPQKIDGPDEVLQSLLVSCEVRDILPLLYYKIYLST